MAYTAEEKETYFNYDESSDVCHIYTCSRSLITKLDKLCKKFPDTYKCVKEDNCSKSYVTSKKMISIRAPKVLSEEHKAKLKLNGKNMNNK